MSDFRKPDFKIYDNGSPISDDVVAAVLQITVDDMLDGSALATVRLRDDRCTLSGHDSKFKIGAELKIELGYVANTSQVFIGEVTGWKGGFPRRGNQTLTIIAQDKFHRLRRNRRRKTFLEMKDSEAISAVASDAGLSTQVAATPFKEDSILQWNQTDADFILERAHLFGMEVYVDAGKLILQEPKLSEAAVATITWHKELHNFTTSVSLAKQQKELKVSGWDMVKKEATSFTAKKGDERNLMGGTKPGAENVAVFSPEANWRATTPAATAEQAEAYAKAWFQKRSERYLVGEGICEGDPTIQRGKVIELEGLGELLSGKYYARRVIHTLLIGSGYTTTFRVIRTAVQKPDEPLPQRQESQPEERPEPEALLDPDWEGDQNPDGTLSEGVETTFDPKVVQPGVQSSPRGAGVDAGADGKAQGSGLDAGASSNSKGTGLDTNLS